MVQLDGGGGGGDGSDTTSSDISGIFGDPAGDGGDTTTTDDSPDPEPDDDGGGGGGSSFDPNEHLDGGDDSAAVGDDDGGRQTGPGPGDDGPRTASGDQQDTGATPVDQGGDDPATDDVQDVDTGDFSQGQLRDVADQFEEQVRDQTGQDVDFDPGDVEVRGDQFVLSGPASAALSRQQAREAGRDLTDPGSGPFRFGVEPGDPALESGGLEVGTGVFGPAVRRRREPTDISGLELGDVLAEQRQETREELERRLEAEVGTDLGPGDIEFEEADGQITATLTEAGERSVQVERAPIVGAAETLGLFETQARDVAGAAVTFREFGQEQRERFVEPSLQSLREATGLESEIEAFESLQDQASAAEQQFLQPATELATDLAPEGLAAGAVAVGTRGASLTPPGRVAVGATLATGAAAEAFQELSPEQQLAVSTAVGTASAPAARAERSLLAGDVDAPTVRADAPEIPVTDGETDRGEMVIDRDVIVDPETGEVTIPDVERGRAFFPPEEGALPPDQAPPELEIPIEDVARRERVSDAITFPRDRPLPIQEDPIFLPEVQTPTAPKSEFNTGRHTPPEVPVDTADPTEPFGGTEIPLDDDLDGAESAEDFVFPGPEVPTPGQPTEEFAEPAPVIQAAQQQETILRRPEPTIPQDPADIARQTGPGGPAFIIGQDPRVAPTEPVLETPIADIDLSLVRPDLARVLREGPELTAEDIFDATLPGTEATGRPTSTTRPGLLDRATPDQAPGLDESVSQTPRTVPGVTTDTVTTPGVDTGTGTPTVTGPEFGTPTETATGPGFGTPTTTATAEVTETPAETLPALELESEDPRRRERDIDEFEREFLEPVISPEEALEADRGGPEAMDLSDDMS